MRGSHSHRPATTSSARSLLTVVAAVVLVGALSGSSCRGGADVEQTPAATGGDPSAAASPTAATEGGGDPGGVTEASAGLSPGDTVDAREVLEPIAAAVAAAGSVRGLLVTESPEGRLEADVQYDFDVPGARLSAQLAGDQLPVGLGDGSLPIEGLLLPGEVYLGLGELGGPTPWVRLGTDGATGGSNPFEGVEENLDATRIVEDLEPGAELSYEGTEDVNGTPTDRWSLATDPAETEGVERVDYWIAADDLPARFATEVSTTEAGLDGSVEVEYSEWGAPVDLTPPPASEVTDLSELAIP